MPPGWSRRLRRRRGSARASGAQSARAPARGTGARARAVDGTRALRQFRHRGGDERGGLARASTGRDKIVKFAGCYHGHADSFLVESRLGRDDARRADEPGVARAVAADTLLARYNDLAAVEVVTAHAGAIAAVIVEPIAGNIGSSRPPRASAGLRTLTERRGILLIFDEVIRLPRVGWRGTVDLRHHAGSHVPRQDHRRRPAGRRLWRPRRPHGHGRSCRSRLPGGHAVGEPAGDDRGAVGVEAVDAAALQGSSHRGSMLAAGFADAARHAGVTCR